ncbi:hypothetical protein CVT17_02160 [Campylobacter concisus]|uniref:Uncharacterized protein n=1 Tax=Campylobacter concisus TaxID=199 RepID=A0AAE7PBH0_9BACT|nr:hypothetical protein [Campylobacter concisus]QPH85847.1 hypothetical protein CVT17_02160 [Campylobacter concisus]
MVRNLILIAGFIVLFGAIWGIKDEKISKSIKALVSAVLVAILVCVYFYEENLSKNEDAISKLVTDFKQGKVLKCGEYNVSAEKFNYEFGTASFLAKREFSDLSGVIVPIKSCEQ